MLRVIVESASNIPKTKFGKPDPIVSVIFKDEKKKTKKVDNELNPVWNEILEFDLRGIPLDFSSSLTIVVKDFETIGQNNGQDKFVEYILISCGHHNNLEKWR